MSLYAPAARDATRHPHNAYSKWIDLPLGHVERYEDATEQRDDECRERPFREKNPKSAGENI